MIDIIKQIQEANPALGTTIIVLRPDSRALADPATLTPEAKAWLDANTSDARLSQETVMLAYDERTIASVDRASRVIVVTPPEGLLE